MGTLNKAPVVELGSAFEDDYFVGPPPGASSQLTHARPNPWKSPATRGRPPKRPQPIDFGVGQPQPTSSTSNVNGGSLTDPVEYTPCHPSQLQTTRPRCTPSRRGRRSHSSAISNTLDPSSSYNLTPRVRPALSSESIANRIANFVNVTNQPTILGSTSLSRQPQHPAVFNPQPLRMPNLNWNSVPPFQPKFAGAPNFTTFGNGVPQTQGIHNWNSQLIHQMNQSQAQQPLQAHSNSIPNTSSSSLSNITSMMQAGAPGQVLNQQVPANSAFVPQAQPVRPAILDFIRHISNSIPGVNADLLISQLNANPNQIQIPVPSGMDSSAQFQFQRTLETLLLQSMNLNGANPQQPQQPQIVNAAVMNSLLAQQGPGPRIQLPPSEDDMALQDQDADANNDEEYHEVETYSDYAPAKLKIGRPHPDPVVETSSLSTVEPPDITYELKLPSKVVDSAMLSALQLESVIYASQQHSQFLPDGRTRRGFLIGDGAGVGKGRTIAGIIYENYLCGRKKSIWFSVSTDLKLDAERDLKDIGAKIPVFLLNKFPYGRRINEDIGVIFTTYSGLVSKSQSVRGNLGSRLGQLVTWAGANFDGVIVFDECHKAKNISMGKQKKQSKAAELALEIQKKLPNARVVYASATGASETKHLGYMTRLGIWGEGTPYQTFSEFCDAIEKRGVGAMELVAVDLKMRGAYIARQLSFKTTSFEIRIATLDDAFIKLYDDCVDMWSKALKSFIEAESCFGGDKKRLRTMWSSFWAAHQKFFKFLCISAKVPLVVDIANEALKNGKCVVIGLQSTGEAKTLEALDMNDGDINEFVSTAKATFESLIENHFPAPGRSCRRKAQSSEPTTDSELDFTPLLQDRRESASNSGSSSSTDELLFQDNPFRFVLENGVVEPKVDESKMRKLKSHSDKKNKTPVSSTTTARRITRNQQILKELVEAKKTENQTKSTRALRAKRRASNRRGGKSRIKVASDDSDTEISNPLSSCSSETMFDSSSSENQDVESDETYTEHDDEDEDDDDDYDDSSTVTEGDDELSVIGSKAAGKTMDESDSNSDVQITAVKPRRNYDVIILSSDEEETEETEDDPMVKHGKRLSELRDELFSLIDAIGPSLPNNTLDDLINRLGGPTKVAEMTGRKGRVVKDDDGMISYRQRNEEDALEDMNIAERERFMSGKKLVAIISEAASSGISLQADKRVANKKRRVHITIELPWSADRAVQQFGRTHRSNQLSGPEYVFIISELAGEKRFASIVAKRLESLGALTHGDRRANNESRDLSQFNIDSKYSRRALENLRDLLKDKRYVLGIEPDYPADKFIDDARNAFIGAGLAKSNGNNDFTLEPNATQMNQFLNRLLGMKVRMQNAIFKLFTDYTDRIIARNKATGKYDAGILELNSESGKAHCDKPEHFNLKTKAGVVQCSLRNVQVERGISWNEAIELLKARGDEDSRSGFYATMNPRFKVEHVFLILREPEKTNLFRQYKPNTGRQPKALLYSSITQLAQKISTKDAERIWNIIYETTNTQCVHLSLFKTCKRIEAKMKCDVGLRHRLYCILSGSVLTAWPYLERKVPEATNRIQIVRLRLDANNRVIGPVIPRDHVEKVKKALREGELKGVEF